VARATLSDAGRSQEALVIGHPIGGLGAPPVAAGRGGARAGELVVDRTSGVAVGDEVRVGGRRFTVAGLSADTTLLAGLPVVFMPIADARAALFGGGQVVSTLGPTWPSSGVPTGWWWRVRTRWRPTPSDRSRAPWPRSI
jgi:hypothetical protein